MPLQTPRTWPLWWRIALLLNVSIYNLLGNAYAAGVPPLFGLIMEEFRITPDQASRLSTYVLLTLGISNVFALPAGALIGKRYTILISQVLFLATCLWSAEATSYTSLLVSRILGGLAGGLIEALGPSIVFESFPEEQLARAMVVYVGCLAAGSSLGPLVAGIVAEGLNDWRWYLRILAVVIAANLVGSIIMLPETSYENIQHGSESSKPDQHATEDVNSAMVDSLVLTPEATAISPSLKQQWLERSFSLKYVRLEWRVALHSFYQPLLLIILPEVLVTTLVFGLTIGWTVLISNIVAVSYGQPPLLWGPLPIGLISIGPLVGLLIGIPFGGALADFLSNRVTKRSGGNQGHAARLPAALIGALISPAGCLVLGFGLRNPSQWAPITVGWAMVTFSLTGSANVLLTYAVDMAPSRATHIGALINLTKNSLAFGVSYTSVSWMEAMGPVGQFGTMAGLLWFVYLLVIPMWLYRRMLQRKTPTTVG